MGNIWFKKSFRRNLIDMHIADWDERFLSGFNPETYAEMLKLADVDTAIIYSGSCLGNCYWPTKVGHMHKSLKGRDILKETIIECKKRGLNVVVYFNIWSRWAYDTYPDWRIRDWEGKGMMVERGARYGVCCPNSPFRDYVKAQIEDLCSNYEFDGMWIDMIGWIGMVCYCPHCKKRYYEETGMEIPYTIDWKDKNWVTFQRKREEWMAEFAEMITNTAKEIKPGISLVHQCASWLTGWAGGASYRFFKQSDYLAGDFYSGALEQSLICKFLNSVTENRPIEFMTSRCPDLTDHTTLKQKELLEAQVYSSISNNAAFVFIDAIDPVGTINREVYKLMGNIFKNTKSYEKYLDPSAKQCFDVGIYMDFSSFINFDDNGKHVKDASYGTKQIENTYNIAKTLIDYNIPYGVVTAKNLNELEEYQVIVLSDIVMLDQAEIEALKKFVQNGGSIYASGRTSLLTKDGSTTGDFQLAELFGISYNGETDENITYMAPTESGQELFTGFSKKYPMMISDTQIKVRVEDGTNCKPEVLAKLSLPYTNPKDNNRFSSAISNPPGIDTNIPSMVLNRYGRGRVIYSSGKLEIIKHEAHREVFANIIKHLFAKPAIFETNAYKPVEITLFNQDENRRYIINVLNYQKDLPNIPVDGIWVRIFLDGKIPVRLIKLPEEENMDYSRNENWLEFKVPRLVVFSMFALDYDY